MAERLSTGFANAINITGSVKDTMQNGVIYIYAGAQPANADAVETGTLLMILSVDAALFTPGSPTNGLNMDLSVDGVLSKSTSETWQGVGTAEATELGTAAGWFRWYANDRVMGASTTAIRVDGSIGTSSSYEMQMSNTTIVTDGPSTVNTFTYTTVKA